jgi:molybdenum cofactor synthesis domain-containing protein
MAMVGRVEAICTSPRRGVPKTAQQTAQLRAEHGIEGDAHAGLDHRQVSILAQAEIGSFERKTGLDLAAGAFAENLVVSGLDLTTLGLGSRLRLGNDVTLSISQHGKQCHHRCAIFEQTGDCIMPRVGLFARVLTGGRLALADPVYIEHVVSRSTWQAVVLTVSDRCAAGAARDTTGPAVAALLRESLAAHIYAAEVIPDGREGVAERLCHFADGRGIDLVIAAGGTGLAPRDQTPEAVRDVVERLTPGFDEVMRAVSAASTPLAVLSRACSGIRGSTLILSLPGSPHAAVENLSAILASLPHGLAKLRGDREDCGRPALGA